MTKLKIVDDKNVDEIASSNKENIFEMKIYNEVIRSLSNQWGVSVEAGQVRFQGLPTERKSYYIQKQKARSGFGVMK